MATPPPPPAAHTRILDEMIARGEVDTALPSIAPPDWQTALWEQVDRILEPITRMLEGIFSGSSFSLSDNAPFVEQFLWLLLLTLGLVITLRIGWIILSRSKVSLSGPAFTLSQNLGEELERSIRAAVARHDLSEATRLVWRLFLWRQRLPLSLTPMEYQVGRGRRDISEIVNTIYALMFSGASHLEDFERCNEVLLSERKGVTP